MVVVVVVVMVVQQTTELVKRGRGEGRQEGKLLKGQEGKQIVPTPEGRCTIKGEGRGDQGTIILSSASVGEKEGKRGQEEDKKNRRKSKMI